MLEFTLEKSTKGEYKKKGSDFYSALEPVSSIKHIKSIYFYRFIIILSSERDISIILLEISSHT